MTFPQGEDSVYLTGVDDKAVSRLPAGRQLCLDYPRQGNNIVQIYNASPYEGIELALLEKDKTNGGYQVSLWSFK